MSRKRIKQYLMLLTVIGLVAVAGGGGTFASFSAEADNPGNTFQTGTLLLSNKVTTGTACYSNENAANVKGCSALITTPATLKPGDSFSNYLTIKNEGTLSASALTLYLPATQTGSVSCANTTTGTFPGTDALAHTGDVCGTILFSLEQDATAGGTASACVVGTATAPGTNDACDPAQGVSFATFMAAHDTAGTALGLGTLSSAASKFYRVYLYLPSTADNTFQGRAATFDLDWRIVQ